MPITTRKLKLGAVIVTINLLTLALAAIAAARLILRPLFAKIPNWAVLIAGSAIQVAR